jgi:hypothetical protein
MVGERENDIYEVFVGRPEKTHLIVRAGPDRLLTTGAKLFDAPANGSVVGWNVPGHGQGGKIYPSRYRIGQTFRMHE